MALRFHVVKQPALLKRLEVRLVRAVWRMQRATARRLGHEGTLTGGAVCFWQYFGSSLQLTPHLHLLVPEALWRVDGAVVPLPPPSDDDVTAVLHRVLRLARKDFEDVDVPFPDDDFESLQVRALQRPLPLDLPRRPARRPATAHGFSLHADTAVHGNDRQGLERLCRYGARGPVAISHLRRLDNGRYHYSPKKGVAFTLTAEALVKRLVALTPPPNRHLTSIHGVYAPHARLRALVMTPRTVSSSCSLFFFEGTQLCKDVKVGDGRYVQCLDDDEGGFAVACNADRKKLCAGKERYDEVIPPHRRARTAQAQLPQVGRHEVVVRRRATLARRPFCSCSWTTTPSSGLRGRR